MYVVTRPISRVASGTRSFSVGSLVTQHRRNKQLKHHLTKNLDVSSPPSPLLDTQSLGMNTRNTNYVIAASYKSFPAVITELAQDRNLTVDLIANVIHRAMEVVEEPDAQNRSARRVRFQSELFSSAQKLFLENNFNLFAFFNHRIVDEISSKIQPKKFDLISSLITQPLLRLAIQNRAIYIDPNEVFIIAGLDGFRKISDLFLIEIWNLKPEYMDKFLNSFVNRKGPQFDMVRVWMLIVSSSSQSSLSLTSPIIPKSKWTLKKFLQLVFTKKSENLLREIFREIVKLNEQELLIEIVTMCRSSHSITGSLRYPWAVETLEKWLSENSGNEGNNMSLIKQISQALMVPAESAREEDGQAIIASSLLIKSGSVPEWRETTFLVNTHPALMELKNQIFSSSSFVGISFPNESVVSISFDESAYVIDLKSVEPVFLGSILKRLLNDENRVKVVFSLSKFLLDVQPIIGDTVHFENLVEVRGNRVRRKIGKATKQDVENFLVSVTCPGIEEFQDRNDISKSTKSTIVCEWFSENRTSNLRDLCDKWLKIDHDRRLCIVGDRWDIRPLPEEYLRVAGNDSRVLVMLETKWRNLGIMPVEILSFDPFE